MALYLLRRTAFLVVSLLLAMVVLFFLLRVLPGDPSNALLSVGATKEQIAAAQHQVGSDQPLLQQFFSWFGSLLSLNLGESFISSLPVGPEIAARLSVTIPLTLLSFVLALVLALPIGFIAAWKADRWYGVLLSAFSQLGIAVPVFWVGILLVDVFAITLGWFPSGGFPRDDWSDPAEALTSLALPVVTIAIVMSASISRYVRSATLDVIEATRWDSNAGHYVNNWGPGPYYIRIGVNDLHAKAEDLRERGTKFTWTEASQAVDGRPLIRIDPTELRGQLFEFEQC